MENGFECETHYYVTEDGYINTLHRVLTPSNVNKTGKVVFLQHGLMGTSAGFVMGGPDNSLGTVLLPPFGNK